MKESSVFASEEEFQKIYDDFLEGSRSDDGSVMSAHKKMSEAIENYVIAIEDDMFRLAYEYGYKAAMEKMRKGGAS